MEQGTTISDEELACQIDELLKHMRTAPIGTPAEETSHKAQLNRLTAKVAMKRMDLERRVEEIQKDETDAKFLAECKTVESLEATLEQFYVFDTEVVRIAIRDVDAADTRDERDVQRDVRAWWRKSARAIAICACCCILPFCIIVFGLGIELLADPKTSAMGTQSLCYKLSTWGIVFSISNTLAFACICTLVFGFVDLHMYMIRMLVVASALLGLQIFPIWQIVGTVEVLGSNPEECEVAHAYALYVMSAFSISLVWLLTLISILTCIIVKCFEHHTRNAGILEGSPALLAKPKIENPSDVRELVRKVTRLPAELSLSVEESISNPNLTTSTLELFSKSTPEEQIVRQVLCDVLSRELVDMLLVSIRPAHVYIVGGIDQPRWRNPYEELDSWPLNSNILYAHEIVESKREGMRMARVDSYDIAAKKWTIGNQHLSMIRPRVFPAVAANSEMIFISGGAPYMTHNAHRMCQVETLGDPRRWPRFLRSVECLRIRTGR